MIESFYSVLLQTFVLVLSVTLLAILAALLALLHFACGKIEAWVSLQFEKFRAWVSLHLEKICAWVSLNLESLMFLISFPFIIVVGLPILLLKWIYEHIIASQMTDDILGPTCRNSTLRHVLTHILGVLILCMIMIVTCLVAYFGPLLSDEILGPVPTDPPFQHILIRGFCHIMLSPSIIVTGVIWLLLIMIFVGDPEEFFLVMVHPVMAHLDISKF